MKSILKKVVPNTAMRLYRLLNGNAGRELTVLEDDLFLVSYPKSGNTWVRFMIANVLSQQDAVGFNNIEELIPDIYQTKNSSLLNAPKPRVLKSHEYFDPRYKRVIYIVRDPRDVVISYFHYKKKQKAIPIDMPIEEFVDLFVEGACDGFGEWGENVGSWMGARENSSNFALVRYEDMLENPNDCLIDLLTNVGFAVNEQAIEDAVIASSFNRMREAELAEGHLWRPISKSDASIRFVRAGKSGSWVDELPSSSVQRIESRWGDLMATLGYELQGDVHVRGS